MSPLAGARAGPSLSSPRLGPCVLRQPEKPFTFGVISGLHGPLVYSGTGRQGREGKAGSVCSCLSVQWGEGLALAWPGRGAPICVLKGCPGPCGPLQLPWDPLGTATIEGSGGSAGSARSGDFHGEVAKSATWSPAGRSGPTAEAAGVGAREVGEVPRAGAGCRGASLSHTQGA